MSQVSRGNDRTPFLKWLHRSPGPHLLELLGRDDLQRILFRVTTPVSPILPAGTGSTADSPDDGKLAIVQWAVEDFGKLMIEPLGSADGRPRTRHPG
ncbi:hypothetical protein GCM10010121_065670 [Streptomyces brasiliensis]|uniref:Uncharacterized protein n=1 Tax=Streptomyces brasiliensis TaxID=1954 RepID=A0A917L6C1_9ACTN|nr:hypothetical protein GCM10010121_065670 [Streptomyces brasiliensis]